MSEFLVEDTTLIGVKLLTPIIHQDERGYFYEQWQLTRYKEHLSADFHVHQSNVSHSKQHVLRGLHLQVKHSQAKLIEVLSGEIFDVVVDVNPNSPTFTKWQAFHLSSQRHQQLFIPKGYAHGFLTLSQTATILYHCDAPYVPAHERTIQWNDITLNIKWPCQTPILSNKDNAGMNLQEYIKCEY